MSHLHLFMVAQHCLRCIIFHPSHNLAFPARDIVIIINNLPKKNSQILKPKMSNLVTTGLGWHDYKLLNWIIILLNSLSELLKVLEWKVHKAIPPLWQSQTQGLVLWSDSETFLAYRWLLWSLLELCLLIWKTTG